jgi:S-DNA-T family DNA segregation ATPase FtsK/SpoIIIE
MPKRRHQRTKSKKSFKVKLKPAAYYSIAQIFFFLLAVLIFASFARRGLILETINTYLISYFGWTAIFLPFIFLTFGFLMSKFKTPLAQPNVVAGALLFALAIAGLTSSGQLGLTLWEGIAALVTPFGAFTVFFGSVIIGLIIMFNTSLDQLYKVLVTLFRQYGIRGKEGGVNRKPLSAALPRKEMKVIGDTPQASNVSNQNKGFSMHSAKPEDKDTKTESKVPLEEKLVSNIPGVEKVWKYPPIEILTDATAGKADRGDIKGNAGVIEQTLESFGITAHVVEVNLGPAVTQYALEVALGTKLSKITALERDLALALAAPTGTIRIEAPIPGRSLVGIELPNRSPEFVSLKKMMSSSEMRNNKSKLAVSLGLDVSGKPVVGNIGKMPHVLIAGQTGSGKSVCINTFLCSLLLRASPSEVKFIMVDPKRVELTGYNNIPHLLSPVIVEPEKVISALRWLMSEMDRRYQQFAQVGVRNIDSYNEMSGFQALPYIVLIIDELADVMLFSPVEVEDAITRIAQMARATGIHMVLATQRPSVDVITGLIKANIPCRIAFAVSSQVDSRVILDGQGAEKLLGKGDMLYLAPEQAKPTRIQGAFISDKDTNALVSFLKNQGIEPQYTEEVLSMGKPGSVKIDGFEGDMDNLFKEAVGIVCQYDKASASLLQRRLSVGYARAARIMDQLEQAGVIGPADGSKPREVLIQNPDQILAPQGQST